VFLKLDTQGYDLEVFEGASGCLDQIRGVQTEISVMPIYKGMPTFENSIQVFKSKGFEVSGLYSLSESRFPYAVEFDCIYLTK
jgi:Methyltransferase FkbM domain